MNKIYFSPCTAGFYQEVFKEDYLKSKSWPNDLFEVSKDDYDRFALSSIPEGKSLSFRDNTLILVDTNPNPHNLRLTEIKWIEDELVRIRDELEKVQDADPSAVGTVSQWRTHRKNVRAWLVHEKFPDFNYRPKSPNNY